MRLFKIIPVVCLQLVLSSISCADDLTKAESAVSNVLFDFDGSFEYSSYVVKEDGHVELIFAENMPDQLYEDILTKLKNHPDISSVLASKGGPICKLW